VQHTFESRRDGFAKGDAVQRRPPGEVMERELMDDRAKDDLELELTKTPAEGRAHEAASICRAHSRLVDRSLGAARPTVDIASVGNIYSCIKC